MTNKTTDERSDNGKVFLRWVALRFVLAASLLAGMRILPDEYGKGLTIATTATHIMCVGALFISFQIIEAQARGRVALTCKHAYLIFFVGGLAQMVIAANKDAGRFGIVSYCATFALVAWLDAGVIELRYKLERRRSK